MSKPRTYRPRLSPPERATLLQKLDASGLSKAAFCRQQGIPRSTLDLWLRQRKARSLASRPVPVEIVDFPSSNLQSMGPAAADRRIAVVTKPDGTVIEIGAAADPQSIRALLGDLL